MASSGRLRRPMTARAVNDFPEPDSPTRPTRSTPISKEIESTMGRRSAAMERIVRPRTESSECSLMARIAEVAQTIGQGVAGKTDQENGRAWKCRYPPLVEDHSTSLRDHHAPLGGGRPDTQPQKTQSRGRQNHACHIEGQAHASGWNARRQDVSPEQPPSHDALHFGRSDVIRAP